MASTDYPAPVEYPGVLAVDLRILSRRSLDRYHRFHDLPLKADASHAETALSCAHHFRDFEVSEADVLDVFLANLNGNSLSDNEPQKRTRTRSSRRTPAGLGLRRGDQVACETSADEWILATVIRYNADADKYVLEDEDDEQAITVASEKVLPLNDSVEGVERGCEVLAVFPDTTSFYRAFVSRNVRKGMDEITVQFVDDEDAAGRTPHRKVQARFVFRASDVAIHNRSNVHYDSDGAAPAGKRRR